MQQNRILLKQLQDLSKTPLPSIKAVPNESNMSQLFVTFYYQKSNGDDMYPYFIPKDCKEGVSFTGILYMDNFPNKPPKLVLDGFVAHCHVHQHSDGKYVICFSLDESYEWFFGSKHMLSSKFNPSISLSYYLRAVYKFLAEDDREYEIGDERRNQMLTFWAKQKINQPDVMLPYNETLAEFTKIDDKRDVSKQLEQFKKIYNVEYQVPENIAQLSDYVDKGLLLFQNEPVVIPINAIKMGQKDVFKIVSLDMMKYATFKEGIRKTSLGVEFNSVIPLVLHSNIWSKKNPKIILDNLTVATIGQQKHNQIIFMKNPADLIDHELYLISDLFNQLAVDVFSDAMFPCEEVLKCFMHLHHLLAVLTKDCPSLQNKIEQILDQYEKFPNNRQKKSCGNLGILMTQYMMTKKDRDIGLLVEEVLARNVLWSLKKPETCLSCVGYNKDFYITDINEWINTTWTNSSTGLQRFAFQQLYNKTFKNETLSSLDKRFGHVTQEEIELFQKQVKEICSWKSLNGLEGYAAFFNCFNMSTTTLKAKLQNAFSTSTKCGYHKFVVNDWGYNLKAIENAKIKR